MRLAGPGPAIGQRAPREQPPESPQAAAFADCTDTSGVWNDGRVSGPKCGHDTNKEDHRCHAEPEGRMQLQVAERAAQKIARCQQGRPERGREEQGTEAETHRSIVPGREFFPISLLPLDCAGLFCIHLDRIQANILFLDNLVEIQAWWSAPGSDESKNGLIHRVTATGFGARDCAAVGCEKLIRGKCS